MPTPIDGKATDAQVSAWRDSGKPYQQIAAEIAVWARDQERGTILPDNSVCGIEASGSTFKRAKAFLVAQGVLSTDDGPFQVALPRAPAWPSRVADEPEPSGFLVV